MDVYQGWFNLKPGVSDMEFAEVFAAYMAQLQSEGWICGWRLLRCKLGLRPEVLRDFQFIIETSDMGRLDAAFRGVSSRAGPLETLHHAVNAKVERVFFALYRDFPDPHRIRGEEAF